MLTQEKGKTSTANVQKQIANPPHTQEQPFNLHREHERVALPQLVQERGNQELQDFKKTKEPRERQNFLQAGYGRKGQFGWNFQNPAQDQQCLNPRLLPHNVVGLDFNSSDEEDFENLMQNYYQRHPPYLEEHFRHQENF